MISRHKWFATLLSASACAMLCGPALSAADIPKDSPKSLVLQDAPHQAVPPRLAPAWGPYNFPRELDAEIADGDVHRVLYEDSRVMFLEVANPPAINIRLHGHPYPSVFTHDAGSGGPSPSAPPAPPGGYQTKLDPNSEMNGDGWGEGPAPKGMEWPTCTTASPQAPHRPFNANKNPNHFYRLEFLRLDGEDIKTHWKDWYPEAAKSAPVKDLVRGPALGPNFSKTWPYPIVYDSIQAAPDNYKLLYEDAKMRLIEVVIRPGETTPMHGHPYAAVLAYNAISGADSDVSETFLDPTSAMNGQGAGHGPSPTIFNMKVPLCTTFAPQAPHKIKNAGSVPLHYYRIEYKRIDGDGMTANWRKWYPWMQYMQFMRQ